MSLTVPVPLDLGSKPYVSRDPAELLDFARPRADADLRFDHRGDDELEACAFDMAEPLERERALWELADRQGDDAVESVLRFIAAEPDRAARRHAVWLLVRIADEAPELLSGMCADDDPDVADWARALLAELTEVPFEHVYHSVEVDEDASFDQTLPLLIAGHVLVRLPSGEVAQATLSPLWFEAIMGRVMACTNRATVFTDLVIEKALDGLHPDGSPHYEIFKFAGASTPLGPATFQHHYVSLGGRRFYPSGEVENGEPEVVPIELQRVAETRFTRIGDLDLLGDGPRAEALRTEELPFVDTVRGRYSGWASVDLDRVAESGRVGAGSVQLSSPTHPVAGPMTNARLFGTFRGKVSDWAGSGRIQLNAIPCHGTVDGEHDLLCDGSEVDDRFGP
jgi:hypothetical protein